MKNVLKKIFCTPRYAVTLILIFFIVLDLTLLFQNFPLLWQFWQDNGFVETFKLTLKLLGSLATSYNIFTGSTLVLICFLFGLNFVLMMYLFDKKKEAARLAKMDGARRGANGGTGATTTTFGLIVSVLGIGCASCGSLVITALLSAVGLGGVLAILPWRGEEFIFLGAILLLISTYQLLKKARNPFVCN